MSKKISSLAEPRFQLYFLCLVLFAGVTALLGDYWVALAELALVGVLYAVYCRQVRRRQKEVTHYLEKLEGNVDQATRSGILDCPLPVVVFDFGTATTVDAVGEDGVYQGGCISAGLRVTMDALTANTAMLPNVELNKPEKTLNFTAVGHIQAGVVGGNVGAMEYLIRQAKAEMGREDARVVATGGLARFIAGHTPLIDVVDGELILDGLRMIYERRQT